MTTFESDLRRARLRRRSDFARAAALTRYEVPVEQLRDALQKAVERGETTYSEVARRMGWMKPDGFRVRRAVGIAKSYARRSGRQQQEFMSYDLAMALAEAIGVDPVDVGL